MREVIGMDEKQEILKQKKKNLSNMEGEMKRAKEQIAETKFLLGLLEEEMRAKRMSHAASQKAFVLVNVTWEFERDPEYVEALKIINNIKFKKNEYDYERQKEQMTQSVTTLEEQLAEATNRVEELHKEIQDLKDDLGEKDE